MKTINNFSKIYNLFERGILTFEHPDSYYFLQVIKRRKENPTLSKPSKPIKEYIISSVEDLKKLEPSIIEYCESNNARAYFKLNSNRFSVVSLKMIRRLTEYIESSTYNNISGIFASCSNENGSHQDSFKKWIIDIDDFDEILESTKFMNIEQFIIHMMGSISKDHKGNFRDVCIDEIPTLNGVHIITRPFNSKQFAEDFPNLEIKKQGLTLLYVKEN